MHLRRWQRWLLYYVVAEVVLSVLVAVFLHHQIAELINWELSRIGRYNP